MALLRSDILNRDLVLEAVREVENSNWVKIETITIEKVVCKEERNMKMGNLEEFLVFVTAKVKWKKKEYFWIAKFYPSDIKMANAARYEGHLETELQFYRKFCKAVKVEGIDLPKTTQLVSGNISSVGKEVLIVQNLLHEGFTQATLTSPDAAHILLAIKWLARFHGCSFCLMDNHQDGPVGWLKSNPWVRKDIDDNDNILRYIKATIKDHNGKYLSLMKITSKTLSPPTFQTLCHGSPTWDNWLFLYENKPRIPVDVALSNFNLCSYGSPGIDLGIFLGSSTTFSFRKQHMKFLMESYLITMNAELSKYRGMQSRYGLDDLKTDCVLGMLIYLYTRTSLDYLSIDEIIEFI